MHSNGVTRRVVLRAAGVAAVAVPVAGCSWLDDEPEPPPPPDPLAPLVLEALALAGRYRAAAAATPALAVRLTPIADAHLAHATELGRVTGTALPSPSASASTAPADDLAALRQAEAAGRENAVTACLSAPADRAVLVGTIAAARAAHLEALK